MPVPLKGVTKAPVSGVGDDAVYVTTGGSTGLTKGSFVFQIRVYSSPPDQVKAQEMALAKEVLTKI
jgi:hypothetical protein